MSAPPVFSDAFRGELAALFRWRRDVRRFRPDPLPAGAVERLIEAACLAPSVGFSQPWRFVLVESEGSRAAVCAAFARANAEALAGYHGERAALYGRLKLEGLDRAPVQLAVLADEGAATGHGLGRRTMPETLGHSVAGAVVQLWLAARAEGIGVGWVSILHPAEVTAALDLPAAWRLVAYLCLGWPEREGETPELEREGWERRLNPAALTLRR